MSLSHGQTDGADIWDVCKRLDDRHLFELEHRKLDWMSGAKVLADIAEYSPIGLTIRFENEPCAIFIVAKNVVPLTYFVTTPTFWDLGVAGARYSRRLVKEVAGKLGELYTISNDRSDKTVHWFEFLGFELYDVSNLSDTWVYRA